jgi:hypothetical protein
VTHRSAAVTDVLDPLDWPAFARTYWDRRPVVLRTGGGLFDRHEVFEAAVVAAQSGSGPARAELTVGARLLADPGELLPQQEDGAFGPYDRRLARQLAGSPFCLAVHDPHAAHPRVWSRLRAFLAGLWDAVGPPSGGAGTTLWHGTRPVGGTPPARDAALVHLLAGRRRLLVTGGGAAPATARTEPGDLLYLPPGHTWSAAPAPRAMTAVRIGIPRGPLPAPWPGAVPDAAPSPPGPPRPGGDDILVRDGDLGLVDGLPEVLARALDRFRVAARPAAVERRLAREALRRATDGGLRPVPPAARPGWFTDDDVVRAVEPVRWTPAPGRPLVAACGHVTETDLMPDELAVVIGLLNTGRPVRLAELTPPARTLLSRLAGFRAVELL